MLIFPCLYRKFEQEQWKGTRNPTEQQISNLRLNGWKPGRGSHVHNGPNFFDWFKAHVLSLLLESLVNLSSITL